VGKAVEGHIGKPYIVRAGCRVQTKNLNNCLNEHVALSLAFIVRLISIKRSF
jgi:hypothetical protein